MKNMLRVFVLIVLLAILISSCSFDETNMPEDIFSGIFDQVQVPQLKQVYPSLLKEAQKWNPDAQMERYGITITKEDQEYTNRVYAFFEVVGNEYDYLFIELVENVIVPGEANQFGVPTDGFIPILVEDWKVESDEAWKIFLAHPDAHPYRPDLVKFINILLVRKLINNESCLIWRFSLMDQNRNFLVDASLDANTGDFIEIKRH